MKTIHKVVSALISDGVSRQLVSYTYPDQRIVGILSAESFSCNAKDLDKLCSERGWHVSYKTHEFELEHNPSLKEFTMFYHPKGNVLVGVFDTDNCPERVFGQGYFQFSRELPEYVKEVGLICDPKVGFHAFKTTSERDNLVRIPLNVEVNFPIKPWR